MSRNRNQIDLLGIGALKRPIVKHKPSLNPFKGTKASADITWRVSERQWWIIFRVSEAIAMDAGLDLRSNYTVKRLWSFGRQPAKVMIDITPDPNGLPWKKEKKYKFVGRKGPYVIWWAFTCPVRRRIKDYYMKYPLPSPTIRSSNINLEVHASGKKDIGVSFMFMRSRLEGCWP